MTGQKIKLGVSACLLGQKVRFDGGHKLDRFLTDTLGHWVDWVPVCPEVECGLSVPREAMRLVADPAAPGHPRLVTNRTGQDLTPRMTEFSARRVEELAGLDLCGFVFKSGSPSSGMERVKVYDANGVPAKTGVGLFARALRERLPLLPREEEGRLHDPELRDNFITRVFTLRRWRQEVMAQPSRAALIDFQARHKLLLMAHDPVGQRRLGALAAQAGADDLAQTLAQYQDGLLRSLSLMATVKKNVNVLQHMMGYFKKVLAADQKRELLEVIGHYHQGLVPLIVPVTLLNHYVRLFAEPYLSRQVYLRPHPLELRLRNHA